jgi:hypothetical protein
MANTKQEVGYLNILVVSKFGDRIYKEDFSCS